MAGELSCKKCHTDALGKMRKKWTNIVEKVHKRIDLKTKAWASWAGAQSEASWLGCSSSLPCPRALVPMWYEQRDNDHRKLAGRERMQQSFCAGRIYCRHVSISFHFVMFIQYLSPAYFICICWSTSACALMGLKVVPRFSTLSSSLPINLPLLFTSSLSNLNAYGQALHALQKSPNNLNVYEQALRALQKSPTSVTKFL